MTQWEYMMDAGLPSTQDGASSSWLQRLNASGGAGWELVSERVVHLQYGQIQYAGTFKRPLPASRGFEEECEIRSAPAPSPATPGRTQVLQVLVAEGRVSEEEARRLAPGGRVNDAAWASIQRWRQDSQ
jgi:hypothetical protein